MLCPKCQTTLSHAAKFCPQCGTQVGRNCPACNAAISSDNKFCSECGVHLTSSDQDMTTEDGDEKSAPSDFNKGERRHVTVLFSDLSNYTELSSRYDPEDVKLALSKIINRGRDIIASYEGHIERIIGDEIMAVFGLPKVHEDDAIRAIKAAQELHEAVNEMGTCGEIAFDCSISMHTGINSGLVVTDHLSNRENEFGISGDAVNLASRLSDMAGPNEILVGQETYRQAYGYFGFDRKPAAHIKGKSETIHIYAVTKAKPRPISIRRNLGLSATLIGRKAELQQLHEAVARLKKKQGSIFAIMGDAGTGKSRLLYEFEKAHENDDLQWVTGYAYDHTQDVPYYPLISLLRGFYNIEDTQSVDDVRTRIQEVTSEFLGPASDEIPIIENLYGLENEATESMSPEIWQQRLTNTILRVVQAISRKKPTIICIEDLHWADPPAVAMLRNIVTEFQYPAILICTFRPPFSFFAGHQLNGLMSMYHEIRLGELSHSEAQDLVEALLDSGKVPMHLQRLVRDRAEGNPFYLEELVNSLVDAEVLTYRDDIWDLTRDFKESDIPSTIHGVVTARLDRLSQPSRRLLQEASVIGRVFLYKILQRVTSHPSKLDDILSELEQSGLIKPRTLYPEMEMMFKHALIQEVCYSNLLRTERQKVHERIGQAMETLFADRLNEFYETMAMHYKRGLSSEKAIYYLIQSGNKALKRYALEESQRYFLDAKQLAERQTPPTVESQELLVDVLNQWAFVYYYRGRFRDLQKLFDTHQPVVDALSDHRYQGMYWAWRGWIMWHRGHFETAYHTMRKAYDLGHDANASHVIAHACTWLSWTSSDTGRVDEAVEYADQALKLYEEGNIHDPYIYFNALAGKGYACWHRGEKSNTYDIGNRLVEFGRHHTNVRSMVLGHSCKGWSYLITGDINKAKECFNEAVRVSADPWYARFPKLALSYGFTAAGDIDSAMPLLTELIEFSIANGAEFLGTTARFFQELCLMTPSNESEKQHFLEGQLEKWRQTTSWLRYVICTNLLARGYVRLSQQENASSPSQEQNWKAYTLGKALKWYQICIEKAQSKNFVFLSALTRLGLGECHLLSGQPKEAILAVEQSIELLEKCEAEHYLVQAKGLLQKIENLSAKNS